MVLIEVHLAPGAHEFELSAETLRETKAQVMTHAQAKAVGFAGMPTPPDGVEVRYVAVADRHARWILNSLEANPNVSRFNMHEIG